MRNKGDPMIKKHKIIDAVRAMHSDRAEIIIVDVLRFVEDNWQRFLSAYSVEARRGDDLTINLVCHGQEYDFKINFTGIY